MRKLTAILSLVVGFSGCAHAGDSLQGSEWGLTGTPERFIQFKVDGAVAGTGGCNRFFGSYEVSGDTLTFSPLASTRKACAADIMRKEFEFFDGLRKTARFTLIAQGKRLILKSQDGSIVLELQRWDWD